MMTKKKTVKLPQWDLRDLYESPEGHEFKGDLQRLEKLSLSFQKEYEGKVVQLNAEELAEAIRKYEKLSEIAGKISSYAFLFYATEVTDEKRAGFFQNTSEEISTISTFTLFFALEINKLKDADISKKISESKSLRKYHPWLRDVRVFKDHQLTDAEEKILHEKEVTGRQAWIRLFDETIAGLKFPFNGKILSTAQILNLLSSKKEKERKDAALSLGKTLGENKKTFAFITNILAKDKAIEDNWRKYPQPISYRNLSNYIEDEVINALVKSVRQYYPKTSHRYYSLKAKWFGKKKLDYWDRNAPLPGDGDKRYSWNEAVEIVLAGYESFSPKLADLGRKFFDNQWIDAPVTSGKESGAFAHPTVPSVHPYLLLNYQGKVRDVMTLAHELGHGIHQLLAGKQGALMADTPLTLAETASVFGEQLVFREILKRETNKKRRHHIIAGKVEDMLNTVVRQVAMCEFERVVHDERKKGELLVNKIEEIWVKTQNESFGGTIKLGKEYRHYWSYIPHFIHTPFYVYAYAFGDCLVNALYSRYLEKMPGFEDKYFAMLKAGGTLRHKELLAPFGLNAADPKFWQKGLDIISGFIDELEEI